MTKRVKAGTSKASAAARRARYVDAFIVNGGNKYQAAITAGFPEGEAAKKAATRLSEDVRVKKALDKRRAALATKYELTTDRVLQECARIAYSDPRKLFDKDGNLIPIVDLDDDTAATIASIEMLEEFSGRGEDRELSGYTKKIKVWDKNSAIDKAMKHLGLFEKNNKQIGESLALKVVFGK